MDGLLDRQINRQLDIDTLRGYIFRPLSNVHAWCIGQESRQIDKWIARQIDRQLDRYIDKYIERQTDKYRDRYLEGVHFEALVHARCIREESCQNCLENQTKVHDPIFHALKIINNYHFKNTKIIPLNTCFRKLNNQLEFTKL